MSKLEITGIKIDSVDEVESIQININYKPKSGESSESVEESPMGGEVLGGKSPKKGGIFNETY